MNSNKNKKITVGSLFAGIGGIDLGFQQAGFDIKWANEIDKNACKTYKKNFRHNLLEEDIHNLSPKKMPKVDIITSGFPCQAFSLAGYRRGFKDDRGNLFFETLRFIKTIKPKAFFLENVKNLYGHDKGNTFKVIRESLIDSGYSFLTKIINTKDYSNIPQTRERIYIIGFKGESEFNKLNNYNDKFLSSKFKFPEKIPLKKKIYQILEKEKLSSKYYYDSSFMKGKLFHLLEEEVNDKKSIYQWRRQYVRKNMQNLSPTLTANMGMGGHNVPIILDDVGIRKLTPRECANLQGFPKNFDFPKELPDSQIYKQIGNAVTVKVVKNIANEMYKVLDS